MVDKINNILVTQGISGLVPVFAAIGIGVIGFYGVVGLNKIKEARKNG